MLKEINYLRFFFCFAVFFVHWHGRVSPEIQAQLTYLNRLHYIINTTPIHFAVIGFIVLSGFCIHLSSHSLFQNTAGILKYAIRRSFRIFPVLILGILMAFGMTYFYQGPPLGWWEYIRGFNGPLLTVMLEVLLYIIYVPVRLLMARLPKTTILLLVAVSAYGLLSAFYPRMNWPFDLPYHSLMGYFPYWWLGAGAAHIYLHSNQFQKFLKLNLYIPFLIATIAMCSAYAYHFEEALKADPYGMTYYQLGYMIIYALTIALFLAAAHRKSETKNEISNYLQMPAYSLYAIHFPLTFLIANYWSFIGTIALSYIVYFTLEKPTQNYGIHLSRRLDRMAHAERN